MKKTKEEPSLAGLLLLVAGMLLLSMLLLDLVGSGNVSSDNGNQMIALGAGSVVCLGAGAALSARKKKQPR